MITRTAPTALTLIAAVREDYTNAMKSVADALRVSLRERVMAMTADERVALTARLAEADLDIFCAARHMARAEARQLLERQRESRRRTSCAARGVAR